MSFLSITIVISLGMLVEEIIVETQHASSVPYSGEIEINVSDYKRGMYFIEVDGTISKLVVR